MEWTYGLAASIVADDDGEGMEELDHVDLGRIEGAVEVQYPVSREPIFRRATARPASDRRTGSPEWLQTVADGIEDARQLFRATYASTASHARAHRACRANSWSRRSCARLRRVRDALQISRSSTDSEALTSPNA